MYDAYLFSMDVCACLLHIYICMIDVSLLIERVCLSPCPIVPQYICSLPNQD